MGGSRGVAHWQLSHLLSSINTCHPLHRTLQLLIYISCNIKIGAQGEQSLHLGEVLSLRSLSLHSHGDECRPTD